MANCGRRHTAQTEVTEAVCGKLIPHKCAKDKPDEQEKARNKFLSSAFLAGVDRDRHKQAIDDLNNAHTLGQGSHPEDVPSVIQHLNNRRGGGGSSKQIEANKDGHITSFAQTSRVQCWKCNECGHTKKDCQKKKQGNEARSNAQVGSEGGVRIQSTGRSPSDAEATAWNGAQLGISAEETAAANLFAAHDQGQALDGSGRCRSGGGRATSRKVRTLGPATCFCFLHFGNSVLALGDPSHTAGVCWKLHSSPVGG